MLMAVDMKFPKACFRQISANLSAECYAENEDLRNRNGEIGFSHVLSQTFLLTLIYYSTF